MDRKILDKIVDGYLEAAEFTDTPEGGHARFPKSEIAKALNICRLFVDACGVLAVLALDSEGYTPEQFGRDFWLTRCGHGTGYWDRDELTGVIGDPFVCVDRIERKWTLDAGTTLGRALSVVAYGNGGMISPFAYAYVYAVNGWLYLG